MAVIALGNRKLMMMYSQVSLLADEPNKLLKTSLIGIATCPNEIFNTKDTNNSNVSKVKRKVDRVRNITVIFQRKKVGSQLTIRDAKF